MYKQGLLGWTRGLSLISLLFCTMSLLSPLRANGANSVNLAWNASPSADVGGYYVYLGVESGNYTNKLDVGQVTSATISNLVDGLTYYFAVTAYNSSGLESDYSNEMSYTVPASANQPPTLNATFQHSGIRSLEFT